MTPQTDITIKAANVRFEDFAFRTPLELSTGRITSIRLAEACVRVEDRAGRSAEGRGAIFLGDLWSWPSQRVDSSTRVAVMQRICERLASELPGVSDGYRHPIAHGYELFTSARPQIATSVGSNQALPEEVPELASAVCLSIFDAAIHDAFGRLHGVSAYAALRSPLFENDLSEWLGHAGRGRRLSEFLRDTPEQRIPGWHVVSKSDSLTEETAPSEPDDGLPNSVQAWIEREGVFCFKIKIAGTTVDEDVERTAEVYEATTAVHARLNTGEQIYLEVDSNEACPNAEVVVEYLRKLKERSPVAFDALLFVEQPTSRDLIANPIDMRAITALKPVLVDEGLQGLESLPLAKQLGWSGAALKTCKTQTLALLSIAWCGLNDWPYAVVDLTNPGLAAVQAAGLCAWSQPILGVELNCRQFVPDANQGLAEHVSGLARMQQGRFHLDAMSDVGLGYPAAWHES